MTAQEHRIKNFQDAVEVIKGLGYEVYGSKWKHNATMGTYAHIRSKDGKRVAYFQVDDLTWAIKFSTCHKPNNPCGTGVSINDESYSPSEITEKVVEQALGIVYPYHCGPKQRAAINNNQWSSFDEWKEYESKWCEIVKI